MSESSNPPTSSARQFQPVGLEFDFWRYFHLILRHLWLVVVLVGVAVGAMLAWLARQPDIYAARAVIQVEQEAQKVVNMEDVQSEKMDALDYLKTVQESLTNRSLLLRVINGADLRNDPVFAPPRSGESYTDVELVERLEDSIVVKLRRGTRLIELTVENPNPERAKEIAGLIIKEFLRQSSDQRFELSEVANQFLQEEAQKLKQKLEASEQRLQRYKEEQNAVSLEETQNITVEKLKELNTKVTEAKGERLRLETDIEQLGRVPSDDFDSILQIGSVAALPEIVRIREQIIAAETQFAALQERYFAKHPRYVQAKGQVDQLRAALAVTLTNAGAILRQQYQAATDTESKLSRALSDQEKVALELNKIAIPYNVLLRDVESDRIAFEAVSNRLRETQVTQGIQKSPFRIIEEPMVLAEPVKPARLKLLFLSAVLGFCLACGIIFVMDMLDPSFRSVDAAEEALGLPCLAVVPRWDTIAKSRKKDSEPSAERPMFLTRQGHSVQAEAYRTLRASLSLLPDGERRSIFLFTSAIPAEGKSSSAINAAGSFAVEGLRTLLVDADLRLPTIGKALIGPNDQSEGLTDVLAGNCDVEHCIRETAVKNLFALVAGRRAPNPSELLGSGRFDELIGKLSGQFDRIVIDSAPINAVSDSLRICASAHYVCLIVQSGRTPKRAVFRALRLIDNAGGRIAGFVLNRTSFGRGSGYYYYYYGDSYAKESVYGTPSAAKAN